MNYLRKAKLLLLAGIMGIAAVLALPATAMAADDLYTMMYFNGNPVNSAINNIENSGASNHIQTISPNAFSVNEDGTLKINRMDDGFVEKLHAKGIKVVPYISNHWDEPTGNLALQNHVVLAEQVAEAVQTYNFDGINVDIENAKHDYRDVFTDFVRILREKIPADKEVSVAVAANPSGWTTGWHGSYDLKKLGEYADYLFIMAYDQNQATAGPIAGFDWVEKSVKHALQYVPANKLVLGIPLYGRIWSDNSAFNTSSLRAYQFPEFSASVSASLAFDQGHQSPFGKFKVPEGNTSLKLSGKVLPAGNYEMWFEDNTSIQRKYVLAKSYNLKGVGFWAVGGEPNGFWSNYANWQKGNHTVLNNSGWSQEGNAWKYLNNGYPIKGWQPINGEYYYFDTSSGAMRTGWLYTNNWYYLKEDGKMAKGWTVVDGKQYYMDYNGVMQKGWQKLSNNWYLFGSDGVMKTNWQVSNGRWYFMKANGAMSTGWVNDGKEWYLFNSSGVMQTGWQKKSNKWYLMAKSGKMLTGWQPSAGKWYYLENNGAMKTGWIKLDNKWYYLNSSGRMLTGRQKIGSTTYNFASSGVWIP